MNFVSVKKGHHQITKDGVVTANVRRNIVVQRTHSGQYIRWEVGWMVMWEAERPDEIYKNLYELGKAYTFSNFPGFNKCLAGKPQYNHD